MNALPSSFNETFRFSYAVFKLQDGHPVNVGIVMANNLTLANTKAQRLYGRNAWATQRSK
jgi:hypothetical protein